MFSSGRFVFPGWRFVLSLLLSTAAVWMACEAAYSPANTAGTTSWELLLNDGDVQKELKLTPEQTKKIQQECRTVRAQVLGKYRNYRAPSALEAEAKASEAMKTIYAETDKLLPKVLTAEQVERLKQIDLQQRGFLAEGTRAALQLSPEQIQQIEKIRDNLTKGERQLYKKFPLNRTARIAGWQELRKKAVAKQMEILTAEQRQLWQVLAGEPYDRHKFDESNGIIPKIAAPQIPTFGPPARLG